VADPLAQLPQPEGSHPQESRGRNPFRCGGELELVDAPASFERFMKLFFELPGRIHLQDLTGLGAGCCGEIGQYQPLQGLGSGWRVPFPDSPHGARDRRPCARAVARNLRGAHPDRRHPHLPPRRAGGLAGSGAHGHRHFAQARAPACGRKELARPVACWGHHDTILRRANDESLPLVLALREVSVNVCPAITYFQWRKDKFFNPLPTLYCKTPFTPYLSTHTAHHIQPASYR
jgi:hypothetical protein